MIFSAPPCSLKNAAFIRLASPRGHPDVGRSKRHLGPLVHHAPGLVIPAREGSRLRDLDAGPEAEPGAQALSKLRSQPVALRQRQGRRRVDPHEDLVETLMAPEHDLE